MIYNKHQKSDTYEKKHTLFSQCQSSQKIQLLGINGLKSFAIIAITAFHMFPSEVSGGFLGVCLFLLLTGYLLAYSSFTSWKHNHFSLTTYIKSRFKRIYPALLIVILSTLGIYHYFLPTELEGIRPEIWSIIFGYNNIWQISQNADYFTRLANASPFTHLWFLGIELQYFLIWPILFLIYVILHKKIGYKAGFFLLLALGCASSVLMPYLYTPGSDVTRLYYGTDTRIHALLLGAALGILRANRPHDKKLSTTKKFFLTCLFILLFTLTAISYFTINGQDPLVYQGGLLLATLLFCAMITLATNTSLPIGKVLDTPLFAWFGKKSYGIFLWQYPVLFFFHRMGWEEKLGEPLYYVLIIICILVFTVWTDKIINIFSKPFLFSELKQQIKATSLTILTVLALCAMFFGLYGLLTASDQKINDLGELQRRLEANAALQQQENEKAAANAAERQKRAQEGLNGVAGIGDSVMLGAASALREVLPNVYIDAKVSRYVGSGVEIARQIDSMGALGNVVLIGLGTNGPITDYYEDETLALINYLGPTREIFWVNIYGPDLSWTKDNNAYLEKLAREHENITIIDWKSLASKHPEWLADDGVHPNNDGIIHYAKLVHDTIQKRLTEK